MRAHSHPPHPRIDPSITGQYEVILQEPAVSGVQQKTDKMYLTIQDVPARHSLRLLSIHSWSCLYRMAWISLNRIKKPSVASAIPQKSMGPEPVSSFLPADNAPFRQDGILSWRDASGYPNSQTGFLLCRMNPTSILRARVATDAKTIKKTQVNDYNSDVYYGRLCQEFAASPRSHLSPCFPGT